MLLIHKTGEAYGRGARLANAACRRPEPSPCAASFSKSSARRSQLAASTSSRDLLDSSRQTSACLLNRAASSMSIVLPCSSSQGSKRKAQRGVLGCLASIDCELGNGAIEQQRIPTVCSKSNTTWKMPLLPGLLNLTRQPCKHHRCHCAAHEDRGDHAQDQNFGCHLSAP